MIKSSNLVIKNGELFDDNFACNYEFPEVTESFIALSNDKTYSQTQLEYLQNRLNELKNESVKELNLNNEKRR